MKLHMLLVVAALAVFLPHAATEATASPPAHKVADLDAASFDTPAADLFVLESFTFENSEKLTLSPGAVDVPKTPAVGGLVFADADVLRPDTRVYRARPLQCLGYLPQSYNALGHAITRASPFALIYLG